MRWRLGRYQSPRVRRPSEERSSMAAVSVVPGASKRVRLPRTDFGSRYGKVPIGDIFAIGVAIGVAVISPKSTKTNSKTAFTFPDGLS